MAIDVFLAIDAWIIPRLRLGNRKDCYEVRREVV